MLPALKQNHDGYKFKDDGWGVGNGCDKMADNKGYGPLSKRNGKPRPAEF